MKATIERIRALFGFRDLLRQMVVRDLKLKYRRSFLGYVWSILNPLGIMLVMTMVFTNIFRFDIEYYPAYLISGQILFNFMTESTNQSMYAIVGGASLIKKTYIPKYILILSKVTSSVINLVFALVALLIVMIISRVPFSPYIALFPFIVLQLYIFCLGLGLFLAQATVFFRDCQYIYSVFTTAWLYLTPVFYSVDMLKDMPVYYVVKYMNPMQMYISQFRDVMLYAKLPNVTTIGMGCVIAVLMLALGVWSFYKQQDKFILYV